MCARRRTYKQVYTEKVRLYAKRQAQYAKMRDKPAVTLDGRHIDLSINAGLMVDLAASGGSRSAGHRPVSDRIAVHAGAALSEVRRAETVLRKYLQGAGDRPVVFRTLDIGSDKVLPYLTSVKEENPAIGWRAIRMALDRPALLRLQLRALDFSCGRQGAAGHVSDDLETSEMVRAREMVDRGVQVSCRSRLRTAARDQNRCDDRSAGTGLAA